MRKYIAIVVGFGALFGGGYLLYNLFFNATTIHFMFVAGGGFLMFIGCFVIFDTIRKWNTPALSEKQEPVPIDAPSSGSIEEKNTVKSNSYIGRHWRGENSLAWAYWINLFLLNLVTVILITMIQKQTDFLDEWVPWALLSISTIGISVWSCVGVWRSATVSIDRAKIKIPKRNAFWAYTAKAMVVIGVLQMLAVWIPTVKDLGTFYELRNSDINTQFFIQYAAESDVILNGYINSKSVEAVIKAFNDDPKRTALVMNSPGGLLINAYDLADFVGAQKLLVAAKGDCSSSCLLILGAAETALVTADTKLTFHHPEAIADFVSEGVKAELSEEIEEYYRRFRNYGVPEDKLEKYRHDKLTHLSIGEAYNAYLVDQVWKPESNQFIDVKEYCKQEDCFKEPLKTPLAEDDNLERAQELTAIELRKELPMKIDEFTTLVNVTSEGPTLVYHYILDVLKGEVELSEFKAKTKERLNISVCSIDDMKLMLEDGGGYKYSYKGSGGEFIADFTITNADCS